jgi:hypothetical protein
MSWGSSWPIGRLSPWVTRQNSKRKAATFRCQKSWCFHRNPAEVATSLVSSGLYSSRYFDPEASQELLDWVTFGLRVFFASDVMGFFVA